MSSLWSCAGGTSLLWWCLCLLLLFQLCEEAGVGGIPWFDSPGPSSHQPSASQPLPPLTLDPESSLPPEAEADEDDATAAGLPGSPRNPLAATTVLAASTTEAQ